MNPFVNIHTHHSNYIDSEEFVEIQNIDIDNIANADVFRFYSVGVHPWDVERWSTENGQQPLSQNLRISGFQDSRNSGAQQFGDLVTWSLGEFKILAIGECGLDRACNVDFEKQKEVFIKQISLSEQYAKPLIIHAVRSYPDIISIRKETKARQPWIIHGFQGNEQSAVQLLRNGVFLSLGDVLFKNEVRAKRLLQVIPLDRLFFETDVAERKIIDVYEKAASLSGVEMEKLRNDIFNNFVKIFGQI